MIVEREKDDPILHDFPPARWGDVFVLRLARFVITSVRRRMSVILRCLYGGGKRDRDKQSECTFQKSGRGIEMFVQAKVAGSLLLSSVVVMRGVV